MIKRFIPVIIFALGLFFVSSAHHADAAQTLASRLSGRILIQTEQKGEAWYVNPADQKRYAIFANTAYDVLRKVGIGISNENILKIQIVDINLATSSDSDSDGLSDAIETSFGSDIHNNDTDGDGYTDKEEVINGYNPLGAGKLNIDSSFARSKAGKIFLQVESKGESWYINPVDNKRYYLGSPRDAFRVMRALGLGITDKNINLIPIGHLVLGNPVGSAPVSPTPQSSGDNNGDTTTPPQNTSPTPNTSPAIADTTKPYIVSTRPIPDQTNVRMTGALISAKFSESMNASSVVFIVLAPDSNMVPGSLTFDDDTVRFSPLFSLIPNSVYRIIIIKGAKDVAGNSIEKEYSWSFKTVVSATDSTDTIAPEVASTSMDETVGIDPTTPIFIVFSEIMDTAQVTNNSVELITASGAPVAGVVSYTDATTLRFTPSRHLSSQEIYTLTLSTTAKDTVKDTAGNMPEVDYSWTFSTR